MPAPKKTSSTKTISSKGQGARLDKEVFDGLKEKITRSQVKRLIESGMVSITHEFTKDEVCHKAGTILKHPSKIKIQLKGLEAVDAEGLATSAPLLPYDLPLDVIYEDNALIVINKPSGLTMHPGAGNRDKTLVNALIARGSLSKDVLLKTRFGIVHRLDKDTTGVVVVAKTPSAHAHLSKQFALRTTKRVYASLVLHAPRSRGRKALTDVGTVDANLSRDPENRLKKTVVPEGGKNAITRWKVKERFTYGSFIHLKLETGRTHQIRAHMEHIGAPVAGDPLYHAHIGGIPVPLKRALAEFGRQALHAQSLEFTHPKDERRMSFTSEIPSDMASLIDTFRTFIQET